MRNHLHSPKRVFALLVTLLWSAGTAFAYDFSAVCPSGQTLYYNVIDATNHYVEFTYPNPNINGELPWEGFTEPTGDITLPNTVTHGGITYTVTKIGDMAFYMCDLTGLLNIPSTVTAIGDYAFFFCNEFSSLVLPDSINTIGNHAFDCCWDITGPLNLPNSITSIGIQAFNFCQGINGTLSIPSSLTSLGSLAFSGCDNITDVIYNAVNCTYDGYATPFPVHTITIGTGVQSIPAHLFKGNFTKVYYNAVNCADVTYLDKPFEGCSGTLTIGDEVQRIPAYMFYSCDGFTGSLSLPNTVTTIGECAFQNCSSFTGSLSLPDALTTIGNGAFCNCSGFTGTLSIGNSVTSIGSSAFKDCSGFTGVVFYAVNCSDCSSGTSPFEGCGGSIIIGHGVQRIPSYLFNGCTGFTSIYINSTYLTNIGNYAFGGCSGLTDQLFIPSSITTIGQGAFDGCSNLISVFALPETPPTLAEGAFNGVPSTIPVYVPCSSKEAYQTDEQWSYFSNIQCMDHTVTVTAIPEEGGSVTGGATYYLNNPATVRAYPNANYRFLHWSKDGEVVSYDQSYTFTVTEDVHLEAVFMPTTGVGTFIGEGVATNIYLPSYSFYNYTLSQQIYTNEEIGSSQTITSISFFNAGEEKTRNYDIYMVHTNKEAFNNTNDWVGATLADQVFSGTVTMRPGGWTTIMLDTPFAYDGTSNLALIVDDNTGNSTDPPDMACRVFETESSQAIYIRNDNNNFDPIGTPSYYGTLLHVKNQILLNRPVYDIVATAANPSVGTVSGAGQYGKGDLCRLKAVANAGYTFLDWTDPDGTVLSTHAEYDFIVTGNRSLVAHFLSGSDLCSLSFDLYDSYGDGWTDNYLVVDFGNGLTQRLTITEADGAYAYFVLPFENHSTVILS